jgi:hypothetical protein
MAVNRCREFFNGFRERTHRFFTAVKGRAHERILDPKGRRASLIFVVSSVIGYAFICIRRMAWAANLVRRLIAQHTDIEFANCLNTFG